MKLKALVIFFLILLSLVPVYLFYKWLEKRIQPRESPQRFLGWLLSVLALIFVYTFLVVLVIRILFPGA
ncbi:MAG: hypothetical protein ABIR30_10695 [Chitinophagaceae bacterium]